MADDEEILVKEAIFRGYLNESNNYVFRKSGEILNTTWEFLVIFEDRNFGHKPMVLKDPTSAYISLTCDGLKRGVLVKGKILFEEDKCVIKKSDTITQQQFESPFEEDESRFGFYVENIERKKEDFRCELQFYATRENAFYLISQHVTPPLNMDIVQQLFKKKFDKDLLNLYQGQFSDVTLHCDSKTFKAHKCVLSARSKVFAAMFQNPMKESVSNVVEIKDISSKTLKSLLKYMYLKEVPTIFDASLYDILAAADMYDLQELKTFCIFELQSRLSVGNALLTLSYADLYSKRLKKKCKYFICKEFYRLKHTQEWKSLEKENPVLVNEVLKSFNALVKYYCDNIGSLRQKTEWFGPILKYYK